MVESQNPQSIQIQIRDDEIDFFAGQYIHGLIHVNQGTAEPAKGLIIGIYGYERTSCKRTHENMSFGS